MNLDELVNEFAENVAAQEACIKKADSTRGNYHAKKYIAAFDKLRSSGDVGRAALAKLFSDDRNEVRVMAAAYLLRSHHEKARAVLEEAANGDDLIAFGAQQALERWRTGTWELDPE